MKPLVTLKKTQISRKEIMILILFFLLFKLSLVGCFLAKSGRLSYVSFLKQAVAQEESIEIKDVETSGAISGKEDFESLTLLEKKRKELEMKEEELKQKEERLNQLKTEIEESLGKLAKTEKRIEKLIALKEGEEDKELTKLAKVFEATPPEQAGPMFNKLDVKIAAKILVRMKGRNAGKIWGYVDPDQAVRISKELAKLK
jgi:flagellar motility protein MotE (MotC chaperone)